MNIETQRKIALKILTYDLTNFNLYTEFGNLISDFADLIDICSFLESYLNKHNVAYYIVNIDTGEFITRNCLLKPLLTELFKLIPKDFEKLSAIICKCFDYPEYYATKETHDEGVDIIAYSNHFSNLFNIHNGFRHYIFGQAKKYTGDLVDIEDIKILHASIDLFRKREFSIKNKEEVYSQFKIKSYTPVHAIFFTSYFFTNPALELCDSTDIIPLDIIDIVFILSKAIFIDKVQWKLNDCSINTKTLLKDIKSVRVVN